MIDSARDSTFGDLDRAVLWLRSASGHVPSHPSGWRDAPGCRTATLRGADGVEAPTVVTIDDMSFLLDHSGCRMFPSGFVSEGKCRRP